MNVDKARFEVVVGDSLDDSVFCQSSDMDI